ASRNALTDPYVLLVILLALVVDTLPSLTAHAVSAILGRATTPQRIHMKARRDPEPPVELRSHIPRGSFRRRSSYAFSHQEGYAGLITRGDSLRSRDIRGDSLSSRDIPEDSLRSRAIPGNGSRATLGDSLSSRATPGDSLSSRATPGDSLSFRATLGDSLSSRATSSTAPGSAHPEGTPAVPSQRCPSL
ncbi:phospholipid-transporting ATPase IK-like, partial [Malurus melanocephalus]|uniref:phospholipid-transporting ATPase IK-like n=1 Tax=Malurus melanocephalus TaxID=175006 RepID=UPI0025469135